MQIGIIGKPSSGKSTFFKAATMIDVPIASYPFTTIKPNIGMGHVTTKCACKEYNVKCNPKNSICKNGMRYIPVKLLDVAGLVPDAHLGKGMGNEFLDDLRQASCLIHVVDVSGTTDVEGRPAKDYDPCNDIRFLEREIDLWFSKIVQRALEKYNQKIKYSKVDLVDILTNQLTGLQVTKEHITHVLENTGIEDIEKFSTEIRKLSKPILISANKSDLSESEENIKKMRKEFSDLTIIPTSSASEIALKNAVENNLIDYTKDDFIVKDSSKLDKKQLDGLDFIKDNVLTKYGSTGVQQCLNEAVFHMLGYIVVYPVADINKLTDKKNNVLPDAFLVKEGTTLKEFAGMVHSDMADKFIGGLEAKTKMKLGTDYKLKNNDVIKILFQK